MDGFVIKGIFRHAGIVFHSKFRLEFLNCLSLKNNLNPSLAYSVDHLAHYQNVASEIHDL